MRRFTGFAAVLSVITSIQAVAAVDSVTGSNSTPGKTKIVFLASGGDSHGYAQHEYYAGSLLLAELLRRGLPNVDTIVYRNGWPEDSQAFNGAAEIVFFCRGGDKSPMLLHLDKIDTLMKQGVGITCLHFAVEVPKGKPGDLLKQWVGGYFEPYWSVNPGWTADFQKLPAHPITRGVRPFAIDDEWYYHMRFVDHMEGVTPILSAVPPDSTRDRPDGPYSGNPTVRARKGMPEVLAWARIRPDGGRGFACTGGHWHWHWANDNFRTLVLNGIAWVAKLDVPPGGVPSTTPTFRTLEANLEKPQPPGFSRKQIQDMIDSWNR